MPRVNRSSVCGHSPKNKLVGDIALALEARDTDFLSTILDSNAVWNYMGGSATTAETILGHVGAMNSPDTLTIDRVASHGKVGAVNGTIRQENGGHRFCHVIEFTSVKCNQVRRIESYAG